MVFKSNASHHIDLTWDCKLQDMHQLFACFCLVCSDYCIQDRRKNFNYYQIKLNSFHGIINKSHLYCLLIVVTYGPPSLSRTGRQQYMSQPTMASPNPA